MYIDGHGVQFSKEESTTFLSMVLKAVEVLLPQADHGKLDQASKALSRRDMGSRSQDLLSTWFVVSYCLKSTQLSS